MHNFTSNDLLLHYFNEASPENSAAMEKALENEINVRNEILSWEQTLEDLEQFELSPNDRILENIMSALRHERDVQIV